MEVNIRITGSAGQGMATAGDMLGRLASRSGLFCYSYNDAESRIRGGCNYNHIRIADHVVAAPVVHTDILIALSEEGFLANKGSLTEKGFVMGLKLRVDDLPYLDLAPLLQSNIKAAGTAAVAIVAMFLGIDRSAVQEIIEEKFQKKPDTLEINRVVVAKAFEAASLLNDGDGVYTLEQSETDQLRYMSGADALSLGAAAGGVSFMAAYPMSPATSIMTNLAKWADTLGLHMEQAEDEIAAINMVAGAAYGGARALTATSGGGFALMTEGMSLLGMIETPAVIMIAQRPGPATGLPTRQAQGDLRFAIHGGHGFFPKVVLAPRDVGGNFHIGASSFDIAERYQVPVVVLTDQLLQDSKQSLHAFDMTPYQNKKRYLLTPQELEQLPTYKRFALTPDGISPMAVPGASRHTVVVDSDEHDEEGHLTESGEVATAMAEKRFRKLDTILEQMWLPVTSGEGSVAVLTWGSTCATVDEAQHLLKARGKTFLHLQFEWLWPLSKEKLLPLLEGVNQLVVVEHSVWPEFETVLNEVLQRPIDHSIRKFDGRPFDVADVVAKLEEVLS